ncbi:P-loop containing nucleoside triphosphate hydrolase protein [Ceratobasidium sp. AG-I]|nr:P-loop containing nucleoside triphosphate hydrolase protein [Ceratobasidium sp. AG-I]
MDTPRYPYGGYPYLGAPVTGVKNTSDPDALFTHSKQKWRENMIGSSNWDNQTNLYAPVIPPSPPRLIFNAYDRSYGGHGPSTDDYTWIELRSQSLIDFIRSETSLNLVTGPVGLGTPAPGLDARHIFLQLETLKETAAKLEEDQPTKEETPAPESDISVQAGPLAPTFTGLEGVEKLGSSVVKAARPSSARWLLPLASVFSSLGGSKAKQPIPEPVYRPEPIVFEPADFPTFPAPKLPTLPPLSVSGQLSELLRFVEQHFAETCESIKRMQDDGSISYQLLWTTCVPGTIVESQDPVTGKPIGIRVESWTYGDKGETFTLNGTTYEWNGKMFSTKETKVTIPRFRGLLKTNKLPIRILSNETQSLLVARGKLYIKHSGLRHLQYNSDLYVPGKDGENPFKVQAHGKVMIDPIGFTRFGCKTSNPFVYPSVYEPPDFSNPSSKPRKAFPEQLDASFDFSDDILCLMPPAQIGYSFLTRLWGQLCVEDLSEITFDGQLFDRLLLSEEFKEVIKAQVETYALNGDKLIPNLRGNKRGGMVMVLHGNPGTGKSLTAEAISEHLKLPLYKVATGELHNYSYELESQLRDHMMMAASWNAVVLIDEADIALEACDKEEFSKSSLVRGLLRMMEYQTGVLILKSGSIRNFDKVFTSRFTAVLHYPDLDQGSRLQVWREFLGLARVEIGAPEASSISGPQYISHEDIIELAGRPMNGRAIEQHVRDAQAIAIAKNEPLGLKHLLKVIGVKEKMKLN